MPLLWLSCDYLRSRLMTLITYELLDKWEVKMAGYGPFAGSGHLVWNKLSWDANNAVGLPEQRNSHQSSPTFLCFDSPTALFASRYNLLHTMWPEPVKGPLAKIFEACLWTETTSKFMNRRKRRTPICSYLDHRRAWPIKDLAYDRKNKLLLRGTAGSPERARYM